VPASWVSFNQLEVLKLSNLSLSGALPAIFHMNTTLTNLTIRDMPALQLPNTTIGGMLGSPHRLQALQLRSVGGWQGRALYLSYLSFNRLAALELSQLGLVGTVPEEWMNLPLLQSLSLAGNSLNGSLPFWLAWRVNASLDVSRNAFTGV
jgi:hypothetical protein